MAPITLKRIHSSQVSYIVAIDVWMVMSMIFIILALLETIFVAWMYQKGEQSEASVSSGQIGVAECLQMPKMHKLIEYYIFSKEEKLEPGVRRKRSCCNWKGCAIKVKQSQKRYMVSDSLCLTSFIEVEFKVSLVVSGQRPQKGTMSVTTEKVGYSGSMEVLWGG